MRSVLRISSLVVAVSAVALACSDSVAPWTAANIELSIAVDSLRMGEWAQLTIKITDRRGHELPSDGVELTSSDPYIIAIVEGGLLARGGGLATITGRKGSAVSQLVVTVFGDPIARLLLGQVSTRVTVGGQRKIFIWLLSEDGTWQDDHGVILTVRDTSIAGVLAPFDGLYGVLIGRRPGTTMVTARLRGRVDSLPVSVEPVVPSQFVIDTRFPDWTPTPFEQQLVEHAVARLRRVIVGPGTPYQVDLPADYCGAGSPPLQETVPGIVVWVRRADLSPILAAGTGGPCVSRPPPNQGATVGLTAVGVVQLDSGLLVRAAAETLIAAAAENVVMHEIAHALGIGTKWFDPTLTAQLTTNDPIFIGVNARVAFNGYFGARYMGTPIPLQNAPGPGGSSAPSHWRPPQLTGDFMTPFGSNLDHFSAVTAGALADLGYGVSMAAAEDFTPATPGTYGPAAAVLAAPIVRYDRPIVIRSGAARLVP